MITFILNLIYGFLSGVLNIFPAGTGFPASVHTAFQFLSSYLGFMDVFCPLSVLLACVLLVYGVEIALFGFKNVKWIISYIPFVKPNTKV